MWKGISRTCLILAGVGLFLAGIIFAGRLALDHLRTEERYRIPFTDIRCTPPAGMNRVDFLDEVQYLANMPRGVHLLEEALPERLAEAFAKHPWVEKVEKVQVLPSHAIEVQMRYRVPVLAVPWNGRWRAVDKDGILLPPSARTSSLPKFRGEPQAPQGPAGTPWGDDRVRQQAARQSGKNEIPR